MDRAVRVSAVSNGMLDEWAGLAGKVAVITGGAGGLGRACTVALARAGMAVAVCDRDADAVAGAAEILDELGVASYFETFDVRDSDALTAFFDALTPHLREIREQR